MGNRIVYDIDCDGLGGDPRWEGQSTIQRDVVCVRQGHPIGRCKVYGALGASHGAYQGPAATIKEPTSDHQRE